MKSPQKLKLLQQLNFELKVLKDSSQENSNNFYIKKIKLERYNTNPTNFEIKKQLNFIDYLNKKAVKKALTHQISKFKKKNKHKKFSKNNFKKFNKLQRSSNKNKFKKKNKNNFNKFNKHNIYNKNIRDFDKFGKNNKNNLNKYQNNINKGFLNKNNFNKDNEKKNSFNKDNFNKHNKKFDKNNLNKDNKNFNKNDSNKYNNNKKFFNNNLKPPKINVNFNHKFTNFKFS